jgi:hypothetical protein
MTFPLFFPLLCIQETTPSVKSFNINDLQFKGFGHKTAFSLGVNTALVFIGTIPEPGRLALLGLSLIVGAVVLRKVLTRFQPVLDPAHKANAQAK